MHDWNILKVQQTCIQLNREIGGAKAIAVRLNCDGSGAYTISIASP